MCYTRKQNHYDRGKIPNSIRTLMHSAQGALESALERTWEMAHDKVMLSCYEAFEREREAREIAEARVAALVADQNALHAIIADLEIKAAQSEAIEGQAADALEAAMDDTQAARDALTETRRAYELATAKAQGREEALKGEVDRLTSLLADIRASKKMWLSTELFFIFLVH